ncbi:MAG: hypothetical protein ACYC7J_11970 [Syntrophales bacterium]
MKLKRTAKANGAPATAVVKPKEKGKPKAGGGDKPVRGRGARDIWRRVAALPQWMQAVGGAAVLAVIILLLVVASERTEAPAPDPAAVANSGQGPIVPASVPLPAGESGEGTGPQVPGPAPAGERGGEPGRQIAAPPTAPPVAPPEQDRAFIKTVRLRPPQPTRLDTLKAEVEPAPGAPEKIVYTYLWRVNDRVIEEAKGDTLILSPFKKRDFVTVTVTPYDGDTAGFAFESPIATVHSVPPTLEMKQMRQAKKAGEPVELELAATAPDGERIVFSLEEPRVPGMSVDSQSGKVTWLVPPDRKGTIRFGAAVEDDNGTKVKRVFELIVN